MLEKYLKNLSDLILEKMESGNYTIARFADECDVSPRKISDIKNRKVKNIELETLVKICEAHQISYVDVFKCYIDADNQMIESIMSRFFITDGTSRFFISKFPR